MPEEFQLGDRVTFELEGRTMAPGAPKAFGTVSRVTHGMTMIQPDNPMPMGMRMINIKKVEAK